MIDPPDIDVSPEQWGIIRDILRARVPEYPVWAFGSRARWTAKAFSDLDLAVITERPLKSEVRATLSEDFSESDLPWKVDVVDWALIDESFRKVIERDRVVVQEESGAIGRSGMAGEWECLSLEEAGVDLIDCIHKTPPDAGEGYAYIGIPQMKSGRIDFSANPRRITRDDFLAWTTKAEPRANDVVLSRRCNPGDTAYVSEGEKFALGQNLVLLRADGTRVYPPYLRWLVRGPQWWDQILKFLNVGAVFDSLRCADVPRFKLLIPPLPEQRAIAHILGTLDDKIELNRQMSETLEAMARALFKSWFVDFDPVRAKVEGRDLGLPQRLADLFPARLVDSELGEIPEGWEVGTLGDVAAHPRRSMRPNEIDPQTPYIALEHMPRRSIALSNWGIGDALESNKFQFNRSEILFGKLRPYFHKVGVAPVDGICSTDIVVVTPRAPEWLGFVIAHASSDEFVDYTDAGSTGTKMPRTSWKDMARYELALPLDRVAAAFDEMVRPAIDRIIATTHESRVLAALRDALLPKLISGELSVDHALRAVEEVA